MTTAKGEAVFVSPHTGEEFTSQFAFNDHMARWPVIAEANGLNAAASQPAPADKSIVRSAGATSRTRRRKTR